MPERLDQVFPRSLFNKFEFISGGATGWVFEVAPGIALKFLCPGREEDFRPFSGSPTHTLCIDARQPRLSPASNRRQDPKTLECFEVLRLEPTAKIEQWAAELSSALAWLESIELVQGDLRPSNLLLDSEDHMKLVDFDSCAKIGDLDPGLPPPWSSPNHHLYGAETEQFGFGSILYNMTHGLEPYEDKGPETVELFPGCVDIALLEE
ncbi:Serine/threonine-protein kinase Sgk1-B [Beauveria bassiana]|uniref:Serine/threonine-protein kinase Sgk1-B n=1 Tax=Beauveria bassiana TaxID=176275 RepID=A0A2N6NH58_BEABA|nr:Serine/threonine-protein kinase Sgk1-B [Beauveria bassiana]